MSITDLRRSDGEPHNRITALCDELTRGLPDGIKAIVLLDEGEHAGMTAHGYPDDAAISEAFARHHRAWRLSQEQQIRGAT